MSILVQYTIQHTYLDTRTDYILLQLEFILKQLIPLNKKKKKDFVKALRDRNTIC